MTENHFFDIPRAAIGKFESSSLKFDSYEEKEGVVRIGNKDYTYIMWGDDNQEPYRIKEMVEKNSVMAQNKFFNTLTCYGRGLEYMDTSTMDMEKPVPTKDPDIRMFLLRNSIKRFFAEQIVDMKYYYFSVACIILTKDRKKIVKLVHKDACHCRFEKADNDGRVKHLFFANWKDNNSPDDAEVLPLLDEDDPWGDLSARCGEKDTLGYFSPDSRSVVKYAIVMKMPTVGCGYYPIAPWTASLRDGWYDMYGSLTKAKLAKIKNSQNIRYHVEINTEFWNERARQRGITIDSEAFVTMKNEFMEEIRKYLSGAENSDKLLWSEFDALLDGKERHYLKVNVVDTSKAGNEYNDDIAEAANVLCYDDNVHPNLAGANPGKSQMNNSGSDKRELFTMKQSLETMYHDVLLIVHNVIIFFNHWEDKVTPVIPIIMLTTLDQNTDGKEVNLNNNTEGNNGNTN